MFKPINKNAQRKKRHFRIRSRIKGTASKPRLNVFRSNRQMYCQLIDDKEGKTLAAASTLELNDVNGANKEGAKAVGELIAKRALDKKIEAVVFDRSGYLYHGRVKALAEAAREAGLDF